MVLQHRLLLPLLPALAAMLVVACVPAAPTRTVTVSTPAPAAGPRSKVAAVTLPAGSKSVGNLPSHMELWAVPASYDFTVQTLREQLPIGRDYQGLKWCSQEITDAHTEWDWGDSKDMLDITVSRIVSVAVDRGPGLVTQGREGCD